MVKIAILAAGQGTRMKSDLPKVLVPVQGEPMIKHLVRSAIRSGVDSNPVIITSPDNMDMIKSSLSDFDCRYAIQAEQLGTGHALSCAIGQIDEQAEYVISFYGDHPFVRPETIRKIAQAPASIITLATVSLEDFQDWRQNFHHWGRIVRDHGQISTITEYKDADDDTRNIKEVNPGFYRFDNNWLWRNIISLKNDNAQGEYYLTDLIKLAFDQGGKVDTIPIPPEEAIGINSLEELAAAEMICQPIY